MTRAASYAKTAREFRFYQRVAALMVPAFFFLGTWTYATTQAWTAWSVLAVIATAVLLISYRAAKLEVLANLGIELAVYEQLLKKRTARVRK